MQRELPKLKRQTLSQSKGLAMDSLQHRKRRKLRFRKDIIQQKGALGKLE
jgi:hypothetical protein